jgi:RNA polymerase sigma-70 factor (ECF subfamily)
MAGDSGGKAPQWAERFIGAEKLARVLAAMGSPFVRIGGVVEPHEVNGQPGAIFRDRDGKVVNTWEAPQSILRRRSAFPRFGDGQ